MTPLQAAAEKVREIWRDPKGKNLGHAIAMLSSALDQELAKK